MTAGLIDRVEAVARAEILKRLPADPSGEVENLPFPDLLHLYFAWRERFVKPLPRTVLESRELSASTKRVEHGAAVDAIAEAIRRGDDLTPWLSKRIKVAYEPTAKRSPKLQRREDLDLLLAEWGLHHLHLSVDMKPGGLAGRTDDLLFAAFNDTTAFLVDIRPHGAWTDRELVEVVARNWPDEGIVFPSRSGLRLAQGAEPSADERRRMRNAAISVMFEVDDVLYMPQGQTSAGTPMRVTQRADGALSQLDSIRRELERSATYLTDWLRAEGVPVPAPSWTAVVHDDAVGVLEESSQNFVPLVPLN